ERIGEEYSQIDALATQPPGDGRHALRPRPAVGEDDGVEPVAAFQNAGNVGLQHADEAGCGEVPAQRPQGRRGPDGLAKPGGQKHGEVHALTPDLSPTRKRGLLSSSLARRAKCLFQKKSPENGSLEQTYTKFSLRFFTSGCFERTATKGFQAAPRRWRRR